MHEDSLRRVFTLLPGSYAEVRSHSVRGQWISFLNGELLSVRREDSSGYSLRYMKGGALYFVSSRDLKDIKPSREDVTGWETGVWEDEISEGDYRVEERVKLSSMGVEEKVNYLKDVLKYIASIPTESKVSSFTLTYQETLEEKEVLIAGSALIRGRVPRVQVGFNFVMRNGDRTATAWFSLGRSGGLEVLEELRLADRIGEKLRSVDQVLSKGRSVTPGRRDVVLSSYLSGIMAHESVGHPFEADRVLGREFAQAGSSYMSSLEGKVVGGEAVSVCDDPTIPRSMGFYLIDDQGVRARRKYLIRRGEVGELLHDRFTAHKMGTSSNGSARASAYDRESLVRMSNTFFEPGDRKFEELLEEVRDGVFLKSYVEWNIDDLRLGQRYVGLEAYEIKGGKIGDPLLFPVLEGQTTEFLRAIDAVDDQLEFYPGTCGKGDPDQGIPVWLGGPAMRLRGVQVKVIGSE
jgi:TldD protein